MDGNAAAAFSAGSTVLVALLGVLTEIIRRDVRKSTTVAQESKEVSEANNTMLTEARALLFEARGLLIEARGMSREAADAMDKANEKLGHIHECVEKQAAEVKETVIAVAAKPGE